MKVVDLNKRQPHITITDHEGNVHVIPVSALRGVANGSLPPANLGDAVLRVIVGEYVKTIKKKE